VNALGGGDTHTHIADIFYVLFIPVLFYIVIYIRQCVCLICVVCVVYVLLVF